MGCVLTGFVPLNPPGRAVKCGDRSCVCRQLRKAARMTSGFHRSELPILRGSPRGKDPKHPAARTLRHLCLRASILLFPGILKPEFYVPVLPVFRSGGGRKAQNLFYYHTIESPGCQVLRFPGKAVSALFSVRFPYLYMAFFPCTPVSRAGRGLRRLFSGPRKGVKIALSGAFSGYFRLFFRHIPVSFSTFSFPAGPLRIASQPSFFVQYIQFYFQKFYTCSFSTNFSEI